MTAHMKGSPEKLVRDCDEYFIGSWPLAVSAQVPTKMPDSQKESIVQHKPHCLYGQFRHSEPL